MSAADTAVTELQTIRGTLAPQLEGLRDFQRLNLMAETQTEIELSLQQYVRRVGLLDAALDALLALIADGYPDLQVRAISETALADLRENASTIEAALSRFTGEGGATTLNLAAGTKTRK